MPTSSQTLTRTYPQTPHGGVLVDQVVPEASRAAEIERARSLPSIRVDLEAVITIEMITTGVLSPNRGFMNEQDYLSVLEKGRLTDGTVWPVPLSFAPTGDMNKEIIAQLSVGQEVALTDGDNEPVAILEVEDIFDYDREHRAQHLFGTTDRKHPGVDSIYRRMGDTALGGTLHLLNRVDWGPFERLRLEPKDTWKLFYDEKEFTSVAGFITGANPLHRGHEYIHRNALEEVDGLFLQPLVEMAKREFVRHEYRIRGYQNVLDTYYPSDRSIQAARELGTETKLLTREAEAYLMRLPWPGNVRQLENTCRWLTVMASGREILVDDLPPELLAVAESPNTDSEWSDLLRRWAEHALAEGRVPLLEDAVAEFERTLIEAALKHSGGRRSEAAELLGWGRNTLTRKIKVLLPGLA